MSRKYAKSHPPQSSQIVSAPLRQNFLALDDRIMGASAAAQPTPDMTVTVTGFDYLGSDGVTWRSYAGGTSPVFAAPSTNPKIGLLSMNDAGSLSWIYGTEASTPLKPNPAAGQLPICFVLGRVGMTSIADDDTGTNGYIMGQASALRATTGVSAAVTAKGNARLSLTAPNLVLSPYNGNRLTIDSIDYSIPDAGVTLAPGGLTASTTYYIYAYMNAGVMTLEAVTTAPVTQAGTGIRIKGGPVASRTLVGMARTTAATAWVDSMTQRFVLSYFQRQLRAAGQKFTTIRTLTSASPVEIHTEIRLEFILWGEDPAFGSYSGTVFTNTVSARLSQNLGLDGNGAFPTGWVDFVGTGYVPLTTSAWLVASEGYHYLTLLGTHTPGTGSWDPSGWLSLVIAG